MKRAGKYDWVVVDMEEKEMVSTVIFADTESEALKRANEKYPEKDIAVKNTPRIGVKDNE